MPWSLASIYIAAMLISARAARGIVDAAWTEMHGRHPQALMVGPRFLSPLTREVIVDAGEHYELGTFSWPSTVEWSGEPIPKNDERPEVAAARDDPDVRALLVWSRFPFWTLEPVAGGTRVTVIDARFMARGYLFGIRRRARAAAFVGLSRTEDAEPRLAAETRRRGALIGGRWPTT